MFSYFLSGISGIIPMNPWSEMRAQFTDKDTDEFNALIRQMTAWLDDNETLYHFEYVERMDSDRLVEAQEFAFILHVYDQDVAFQLRMRFDDVPMSDGWKERWFLNGGIPK